MTQDSQIQLLSFVFCFVCFFFIVSCRVVSVPPPACDIWKWAGPTLGTLILSGGLCWSQSPARCSGVVATAVKALGSKNWGSFTESMSLVCVYAIVSLKSVVGANECHLKQLQRLLTGEVWINVHIYIDYIPFCNIELGFSLLLLLPSNDILLLTKCSLHCFMD